MEGEIEGELILREGTEVEVTSDEEGFRGAWFASTIVKLPEKKTKGKALVQYKHLVEEDNQTPLTESFDLSCIRPLPPQTQVSDDHCFELYEVVDAFHLDGWWTGFVSELLEGTPKRYIVSFLDPPEELEFSTSNLRPHWKWVDGKWVKPPKFQEVSSSDCQEPMKLSCNTAKDAETTIQLESSDAIKSSSKRYKLVRVTSRKNEMRLSEESKEPEKSKQVKRTKPEGDATPLHTLKKFKHGSFTKSSLPESAKKKSVQKSVLLKCLQKKYGKRIKFIDEDPKLQDAEKTENLKVPAATEVSEVQKVTKEVETSVTRGLSVECMSGSITEECSHVAQEDMNLHKERGMDGHQKKDGLHGIEQPKSALRTTLSPSVEMAPEEYKAWKNTREKLLLPFSKTNLHQENGILKHQREDASLEIQKPKSAVQSTQSQSVDIDAADVVLEEMVSEEYKATEVESSAISGLEQPDSQAMSIERTDGRRIQAVGETCRSLHENEEQSRLGGFLLEYEKQQNDPREKPLELMMQSPLVGLTCENEPEKGQDLPFVKSLPMWKEIESMEIFKVMPQTPHFHPLVESNEILCEGLAFGHMLSFASLVQKNSKLTVADPRKLFTAILDALPEFEILGFDVKAVRDRTSNLLSLKDRYGDLQHHSKEVEQQVKQCSDELTNINEEIDANYKMVRELEEKQALLLLSKDSTISQITSLEVYADDTTKAIQKVEADFESLAGSTW